MTVTFFGHRDTPQEIKQNLKDILISLIENKNAERFYVGNNGNFDFLVKITLEEIKKSYPQIEYYVILAYYPLKARQYEETIFPEELEKVPKRFAISRRNEWMIKNSDIVVTYVNRITGGAARFKKEAEKRKKQVINLCDF